MGLPKTAPASFFITDDATGEQLPLFGGEVVGRVRGDHLFPDDPRMSAQHARFIIEGSVIFIEDMGSRNGVIINGKKLEPNARQQIFHGDMIEMGNHTFCLGREDGTPVAPLPIKTNDDTRTALLHPKEVMNTPPASADTRVPADTQPRAEKRETSAEVLPFPLKNSPSSERHEEFSIFTETDPDHEIEEDAAESKTNSSDRVIYLWMTLIALTVPVSSFLGLSWKNPSLSAFIPWGANYGPATTNGQAWRLLTFLFLHAGLTHMIGNLFAFWMAGMSVRRIFGGAGLTTLAFASGATGALVTMLVDPENITVGASLAVCGIYGAILIRKIYDPGSLSTRWPSVLWMSAAIMVITNLESSLRTPHELGGYAASLLCGALLSVALAPRGGITNSARAWKVLRPLLTAITTIGALAFTVSSLPKISNLSVELHSTLSQFFPATEQYDALKARLEAREIDEQTFARILKETLLPQIHRLKERLKQIKEPADERREALRNIREALLHWEDAWTLQIKSYPERDVAELKKSKELEQLGLRKLDVAARVLTEWKNHRY